MFDLCPRPQNAKRGDVVGPKNGQKPPNVKIVDILLPGATVCIGI